MFFDELKRLLEEWKEVNYVLVSMETVAEFFFYWNFLLYKGQHFYTWQKLRFWDLLIRHLCSISLILITYGIIWFVFQDKMVRKPADPEEELRWMSQEVRGYVEAVLNSLAANVPKVDYT